MAIFLAFKEVWRNRGRFFLFSLVIALITTLVLFVAALAEGLAFANKEYLSKVNAELVVFQKNVDISIAASRIGRSKLNEIRRVDGVQAIGSVGFSTGALLFPDQPKLNVSLIGIEPGQPGDPKVLSGRQLETSRANEVVIDAGVAQRAGVRVGDMITLQTNQGAQEKNFDLLVVGLTDRQQYLFQPSVFLPYRTWDRVRPQGAATTGLVELISNIVFVKVTDPSQTAAVAQRIRADVPDVEITDTKTAYEALPGYKVQQQTLNTVQGFTLLIGVLVIGGFFQIQLLQKIPQIGVLKAIGVSNATVAGAVVSQIVLVSTFGVLLGSLITGLLALGLPANVPIIFSGASVLIAVGLLLAIGPMGGLVSVRAAIGVEPLRALGLQQ